MMTTFKQTNSYYSYNNRRELLRDVSFKKRETEKKEEPKTYNPCPLDKPFIEPTGPIYKLGLFIGNIFGFFARLFS